MKQPKTKAPEGRWRIMRGDKEVASFVSEQLARSQYHQLRRSVLGQELKLIRPDGTPD